MKTSSISGGDNSEPVHDQLPHEADAQLELPFPEEDD